MHYDRMKKMVVDEDRSGCHMKGLAGNIYSIWLRADRLIIIIIIDWFYIALFSTLEQTHCARM